ncbi:trypsin-like peptidase domain-containing protein [Candidatus Saccharibacteria bacterium]|nr:trypsin-like peptidase domain-containing protein [Candidatus Saccharibacteria bacterium]
MPTTIEQLYSDTNNSVFQLTTVVMGSEIGSGSAFLTDKGLLTADHCVELPHNAQLFVRRGTETLWILTAAEVQARITHQSNKDEHDYALISLSGAPDIMDGPLLKLEPVALPHIGRQVAFLGYPFGTNTLQFSVGYVSSVETQSGVGIIRIDGSVNSGNSGGPLLDIASGKLLGIVTRTETGLIKQQFDQLLEAFQQDIQLLQRVQQGPSRMFISGIDPNQALLATVTSMNILAQNIKRSSNVGIGYAFSTNHLAELLRLEADTS